jgi:hypothetical protein
MVPRRTGTLQTVFGEQRMALTRDQVLGDGLQINRMVIADDIDSHIDLIQPGSGALLSQLLLAPASIQRRLRPTAI